MKITKVITLFVLSYILSTSIALGQSNSTASANVSITLVKALQINQIKGNLSFGELVLGSVSSKLERTPEEGILFEVNGSAGRNVVVDYQNTFLNNKSVSEGSPTISPIQFTPQVNTTYANSNYSNVKTISTGESHQLKDKDGDGVLYLWVGGKMDIDSELPSGNYSGEFAVTVSY